MKVKMMPLDGNIKGFNDFVNHKNIEKVEIIMVGTIQYAIVYWT